MAPVINSRDDLNMGDESSCVFPHRNKRLSASLSVGNEREKAFDG